MKDQKKYIAHLDLDCFFVSVERIKNPGLIGKPVAVGGSATGRGVVASASYEARKFGVHSAMPTARALRLCPDLIMVHGSHGEYGRISKKLYERMCELAPVVERASIDEMNMDFTGCENLYQNNLPAFMKTIQNIVSAEFKLPCSIGLASNKTIAKIAVNQVKPAGVVTVPHGMEVAYLAPLDIGVIPGVGRKTEEYLKERGFRKVSDLQQKTDKEILDILGKHGLWIYNVANGKGSDVIGEEWDAKSISREETFAKDIADRNKLEEIIFELAEDVCQRLRSQGWKARTVTLKLRYSDFKTITRAESIDPTNDDAVVTRTARLLLHAAYTRSLPIRLIGVRLTNFEDEDQIDLSLFPTEKKKQNILKIVDGIRKKFGDKIIHVGGG
ncbi:MAG: DNA polymerase IV [Ignavibacteriae bacterium]|nr:MAG: DNA polymerase IV [Ignavibacteriota bacterium]